MPIDLNDSPTNIRPPEFVCEIPKEAGDLVSTCIYKDHLIVACKYAIFRLEGDNLVRIKFQTNRYNG